MRRPDQYLSEARARREDGRFLAAADALLEGFRGAPQEPCLSRELGCLLHALGDLDGAAEYLRRAHHGDPGDAAIEAELLVVLEALQRTGEVAAILQPPLD